MNALQKTLAMIGFLILVSQSIRHTYLLWVESRGSVLDKYDQPLKNEITNASSLDQLVQRYEPLRKQVDAATQELAKEGKTVSYSEEINLEPYKSEKELREAIRDWESKAGEMRSLRVYWIVGFVLFLLGAFSYRRINRWFGVGLLTAGFGEFIYWTSPTFFGPTREFDRLLVNKLVFSLLSLLLLLVIIRMNRIFADGAEKKT